MKLRNKDITTIKAAVLKAVLLTAGLYGFGINAQSPFNNAIGQIVNNDAALKAQYSSIHATKAESVADNALAGPEVEFEYLWSANSSTPNRWSAGITQGFDWPGAYKARAVAALAEAEASQVLLLGISAQRALDAKLAIIDLIDASRRLNYLNEVHDNFQLMHSTLKKSAELRNTTLLDLKKIELALLENEQQLCEQQARVVSLQATLKTMGATELPALSDSVWLTYPMQACIKPGADTDALLFAMRDATQKSNEARIATAKKEALPGFSIGYRHAYEDETHFNGITLSMALPSWSPKRKTAAARAAAAASSAEVESRMQDMVEENAGLYQQVVAMEPVIHRYAALCDDNSYLQLIDKAYQAHELTLLHYLDEVDDFMAARFTYSDLIYQQAQNLARLNRYRSQDF